MQHLISYSAILLIMTALNSCQKPPKTWIKPETITLACDNYQSIKTGNGIFYNNVWNYKAAKNFSWKQCIEQKKDDKEILGWSWKWPHHGSQIFSYPQIKIGTSPWDPLPKFDDRFPIAIYSLSSLNIQHDLDISTNGNHNVATSLWLVDTADIGDTVNREAIKAEVMIWTYATSGHISPAGKKIDDIIHNGQKYSVWLDEKWGDTSGNNDNDWIYIAFKAETPSLSSSVDAAQLLNIPSLSKFKLQQYYIADIELGTEIMSGEGLLWVNTFKIDITQK